MNILYLNNFFYIRGGAERVLFEEYRLAKNAGHKVAVYARCHAQNEFAEFAEYFPPAISTEMGFSLSALRSIPELIYSKDSRNGLLRTLERFTPNIAHAHNIYGRLSVSVLDALKEKGIPVVLTMHDLKLLCPSYLMLNHGAVCERCKGNKFYRAILTKCHKDNYAASAVYAFETWLNHALGKYDYVSYFISPSRFLMNKAVEFGMNRDKILHIPNFVDSGAIPVSKSVGTYCLFFGRLSQEKGVHTLLQAYDGLTASVPLIIAGDGPAFHELQRFTAERSLPVSFVGHKNGKELEDLIAGARAVIMPSICYENAPLSLLEAFAHGKPVIASKIGGIPEIVDDGENGFLFEPGDTNELREKIGQLLGMTDYHLLAMGFAGRLKVEREYTLSTHYEKILQAYSKAIEKSCA